MMKLKLGACRVTYGGVDIGEAQEVEITYQPGGKGINKYGTFPVAPNPMGWESVTLKPARVSKRCSRPPEGWRCTRKAGHPGPCAAIEVINP